MLCSMEMKRNAKTRPPRHPVEYRVVVDGTVVGQGPHLARYMKQAKRRFPNSVPMIELYKLNTLAVFRGWRTCRGS